MTNRSYSDGTPAVTYNYDPNIANGKGRLASVSSSVSTYTYSSYDATGKVLGGNQTLGSQTYSMSYAYDLAGHVLSETYPSGRTVTNTYDSAGRTISLNGNLGDGTTRNYAQGLIYDAASHMTQEQFGTTTAVFNKLSYNSRGQLTEILAATTGNETSWNRGKIVNDYSGTDNNGNLRKQTVYIPNNDQNTSPTSWYQQYDYDPLNRLQRVHEYTGNTNLDWQQKYVYDRYGNRTIHQTNTWGSNIPKPNFGVNTVTNQLTPPSGTITYDPAGNLTTDTYSAAAVTRVYDAENRMTQETQAGSYVAGTYSYDGDGRRVKRKVGAVETWQVYGLGGELLAEYAANGPAASPQKEYGYRNGQLLVTATVTSGWGSAPVLHDNPLVVSETTVQARHITELRAAIDSLRTHMTMSPYSWQYSVTTSDWITANPILEMRTALDQALGAPSGGYSAGLAQGFPIKAIHIQELRDRVLAAWTSGSSTQINWLVTDQLGTPRMVFDQTGSLASVSRHDYLPFGEELLAGIAGRTTTQGYAGDNVRQKFTQKERDIETGLDYFGARYYASMQGRFTSADAFWKDSQVDDPQSWNKYAYVRNNPLKYVDPKGEKADVEIVTDEKHKTGTVTIKASIAIYAANGSKLSQKDLERAKSDIKKSIEGAWSGTVKKDGITYTVTTQVDVQVQGSENDAMNSGAQNVIGITNGPVSSDADSETGGHLWGPDTGQWNIHNLTQASQHEFGHLLGVDDHDGSYLMNTNLLNDSSVPRTATASDYMWALGGAADWHRNQSRPLNPVPLGILNRAPAANGYGAPRDYKSTQELRAGRIWWN